MKRIIYSTCLLALVSSVVACESTHDNNQISTDQQDTSIALKREPNDTSAGLMSLATLNGQYPADVALLDNPLLKTRLEALLGDDYADFRKYWNTETPIVIEDNVLSTTGCEQHNCGGNQYVLQIDLNKNNINVYHFGKGIKSYKEKGTITLPKGLSKEFEAMLGNLPV